MTTAEPISGEFESDGRIPGGVNVPTPLFAQAFSQLDEESFEDHFGISK